MQPSKSCCRCGYTSMSSAPCWVLVVVVVRACPSQHHLQARTGREAFLLTYRVDWPLSVVISEQSLSQYQLVFRHLFELKYVERELNTAWRVYQTTKTLPRYVVHKVLCYRRKGRRTRGPSYTTYTAYNK